MALRLILINARTLFLLLALLFLCDAANAQQSQQSFMVYNSDSTFVMQYPVDWSIVSPVQQNDRLRLGRNNVPYIDFVINLFYDDGFKNVKTPTDTKEAMKHFDAQLILRSMRATAPDIRLVDSGKTYLHNRDAAYVVCEWTYRAFGVEVPIKQLFIITIKSGYMYTLIFKSPLAQYNSMFPTFQLMANSFGFK